MKLSTIYRIIGWVIVLPVGYYLSKQNYGFDGLVMMVGGMFIGAGVIAKQTVDSVGHQ